MPQFSTVERAFQIAKQGPCASMADLQQQLLSEGHFDAVDQTSYPSVRKQLTSLMQSRSEPPSQAPPAKAKPRSKGVLRLNLADAIQDRTE